MRFGTSSLFVFVALTGVARAQFDTQPADLGDNNAQVTLTFHNLTNENIKDIHVVPPKGKKLKGPKGDPVITEASGGPWSVSRTNTHIVFRTTGTGLGRGKGFTAQFTFHYNDPFAKFQRSLDLVDLYATNDGGTEVVPGDGGNVAYAEAGSTRSDVWPLAFAKWKNPGAVTVAVADTASLRIETSAFGGHAFKLFGATALSTTPAGPDNSLGIDLDTTQPIPASWGLVFAPPLGRPTLFTETPDGLDQALVTISTPDDDTLAGRTFYLVAALDLDGDARFDIFTPPLQITIQPAGTTSGGVVELDYLEF